MGQALYRKYRSKSLGEIVGQEHITRTLESAVTSGRISHAYLFTGPRGVGKTSIARIFAHNINNLPYGEDTQSHIDIIEIDAASNRKLEETKSLIEKVYVAPTSAKYKVYIIDEVHMLTGESFNALLKTLEEPPEHVVFILATTDAHKLPATIISRTQRFQFQPINSEKVTAHLREIASKEKISVDDDALSLMAAHGQGSFRDSISLLDQSANYSQPITAETVNALLGIPPLALLEQLLQSLTSSDTAKLVQALHQLFEQGYPAPTIASQISSLLRQQLIKGEAVLSNTLILDLLERLLEVPSSAIPELYLEISLLRSQSQIQQTPIYPEEQSRANTISDQEEKPKIRSLESKPTAQAQIVNKAASAPDQSANKEPTTKIKEINDEPVAPKPPVTNKQALNNNSWAEVLNLLKSRYNTLYGVVRMASTDFSASNNTLILKFAFPFHQKRVNDLKNRKIIQDAIYKVCGHDYTIECVVDKELLSKPLVKTENTELEAINSIFGGGEIID